MTNFMYQMNTQLKKKEIIRSRKQKMNEISKISVIPNNYIRNHDNLFLVAR